MQGPLALIAEITHRCPLHCVYCSNPLELRKKEEELPTEAWAEVFRQAGAMGVLQLHLTGGEPLARADLTDMVAAARQAGLYVNLITSGIGLNAARLEELVKAGMDHIQLSFQDSEASGADEIAGARAHELKLKLAEEIRKYRVGFTVNVVVHRQNLERLEQMIAMAEELGAQKLEVAHVQYYGWAMENREALLPTRAQVERSVEIIKAAQERLQGRMRIDFVVPDYYAKYPKACVGGWGQKIMLVTPSGAVMPCHAANVIPGMSFERVPERELEWIWTESEAFRRFRGEDWMQEPCRSCDRRAMDFGGCRCQAMMLVGDAAATDPACSLSPKRSVVENAVDIVNHGSPPKPKRGLSGAPGVWIYRQ